MTMGLFGSAISRGKRAIGLEIANLKVFGPTILAKLCFLNRTNMVFRNWSDLMLFQ
jgi:hypothetical protein